MERSNWPGRRTTLGDRPAVDPPESFVDQANVRDPSVYEAFEHDWPDCWGRAADLLDWNRTYDDVFRGVDGPPFEWFPDGKLNAAYNCIDRHLPERKNQLALIWEGQQEVSRMYTYLELYREVNAFAAALREQGVLSQDVVTIYLPMVPELPIAMLACARLGVPHNVVFAGFSAAALAERMAHTGSEFLVTCDGYYHRGSAVAQKNKADNARLSVDQDVEVIVVDHLGCDVHLGDGYDDYAELLAAHEGSEVDPVPRDANDPLFHIYTSGTTGEPKAVTHTTGGYLSHVAWTSHAVLDIEPSDTYWCLADVGWITGHSYIVYGPLALGATTVLYDGVPDHPEKDRLWELVERYAVDVFYTAPTAIRAFMKWGPDLPARHDLSSLRLLGTVGEPIDEQAWRWYREHIGGGECPVVDTWWQTETGAILVSTLPGVDEMKPGSAGGPLPGVEATVVDAAGDPVDTGQVGCLAVARPWPAMPQSLLAGEGWDAPAEAATDREAAGTAESALAGDAEAETGWRYFPDDGATVDKDGYLTLLGRVDDTINVAGRRFNTMELEAAIAGVEGVAEAAVVGADDTTTGRAIYAYVSPVRGYAEAALRERVMGAVEETIGAIATPEEIVFTSDLPKTRSGKVMRRLLTAVANGEGAGDTSALRNPEILGELRSTTPVR